MGKLLLLVLLVVATQAYGKPKLQQQFDSVGPTMKTLESATTGRSIFYLDEGDRAQQVLSKGGSLGICAWRD
jgi:hypothetical protein